MRVAVIFLAAVAFVVTSASAPAAQPPAVQQYVEQLPTAKGSVPASAAGTAGSAGAALPRAIREKIQRNAGPAASTLLQLASSAGLGSAGTSRLGAPGQRVASGSAARTQSAATAGGFWLDGPARWELAGLAAALVLASAAALVYGRTRGR